MKIPTTAISLFALVAFALLAAWGFLIYETYALKGEIREAALETKENEAERSYLSTLRALMREEARDIASVEEGFVSESDIPSFVASLEMLSSEAGLDATIGALSLGSEASGSSIAPLSISIAAKGPWTSVARFMATLDSLSTASKIESVSFSKIAGEGSREIQWNARIDLVQYVDKSIE